MKWIEVIDNSIKYFSEFTILFIQLVGIAALFFIVCNGLINFGVPSNITSVMYFIFIFISYYYIIEYREPNLKPIGKLTFLVASIIISIIVPYIEAVNWSSTITEETFDVVSRITAILYGSFFAIYVIANWIDWLANYLEIVLTRKFEKRKQKKQKD